MKKKKKMGNHVNTIKKIALGVGITGLIICGITSFPMLLGFGSIGIVGGSIAASIQSLIGNVPAGSLFAHLTSLGMTGVLTNTFFVGAILGSSGLVTYKKLNNL